MPQLPNRPSSGGSYNPASVAITGGAISVATLGVRSTGTGAFDLLLANAENLTAARTLTLALGDADRTLSIPASGTVALLGTTNIFTEKQIISINGAASAPAFSLTGAVYAGTGTTSTPVMLLQPSGTTAYTGWSTSGTLLGGNSTHSGDHFKFVNGSAYCALDFLYFPRLRLSDGSNTSQLGYDRLELMLTGNYKIQIKCDTGVMLGNTMALAFSSTANSNATLDTYLYRDAAGTLAQRNGTNAQTLRIYGTTTGSKYLNLTHDGTNAIISASSGSVHVMSIPTSNPGAGIMWYDSGTSSFKMGT